jgi:type II secretory pathway pseudopilin PulG
MRIRTFRRRRAGFTLVEAVISISLAALAGSVLLVGINSSVKVTDDAMHETIAAGIAQQLMDEIVAYPWGGSTTSGTRIGFGEIGDFNGFTSQPPVDAWGIALGKDDGSGGQRPAAFQAPSATLDRFKEYVRVYYVNPASPSTELTSGTSECRAVEVRVSYVEANGATKELVRLRRVISHVTSLP